MIGHDAVLVDHRHYVGGDADRHQIQQSLELRCRDPVADGEPLHELEAYAAARQVGTRIGGGFKLGVEDSHGIRQRIIGHVVVADDEVYAEAFGVGYLVDRLDAAVEDYDEFDAILRRDVDASA